VILLRPAPWVVPAYGLAFGVVPVAIAWGIIVGGTGWVKYAVTIGVLAVPLWRDMQRLRRRGVLSFVDGCVYASLRMSQSGVHISRAVAVPVEEVRVSRASNGRWMLDVGSWHAELQPVRGSVALDPDVITGELRALLRE
jgi:hypothetical protein